MAAHLSGIAVIIFIAFGSLTCILLFIFAKRQITRFALKSRRGPHVAIGVDAPKNLRQEIERRLDAIDKISCEPQLLTNSVQSQFEDESLISHLSPSHLYRMKVVDTLKELRTLTYADSHAMKHKQEDTFQYFIRLHKEGNMPNVNVETLYKLLSLYEHARYQPEDFTYTEYSQFQELYLYVRNNILQNMDDLSAEHKTSTSGDKHNGNKAQKDESTKPLLNKPFLSHNVNKKFTHETSV